MNFKRTILITGGAGFIGSHVVRRFVKQYPDYLIVNVDKLTYAGNLENLSEIETSENYRFEKADIVDKQHIATLFKKYDFSSIIHLAAESHVDRSITNPDEFVYTNIVGTVTILNAALSYWKGNFDNKLFYHISTDEVYGSLGETGLFTEETSYDPQSPYSASKASSDHLVRAYGGWLSASILAGTDVTIRSLSGEPAQPARRFYEFDPIRSIVRDNKVNSSKYVSRF